MFLSNGFKADTKEELVESLGKDIMLQTVLKVRDMNLELFLELLNESLDNSGEEEHFNDNYYYSDKALNFLGTAICPLRKTFEENLADTLDKYKKETGNVLNCYLHGGHGDESHYDNIWSEKDIEKFPDIILSKGFDELYGKEFIDNLVSKGYFRSVNSRDIDEKFIEARCLDEDFTMYGAFLDVLLVDKNKLGDLPLPKTWDDLLNPIYEKNIVTMKKNKEVSTAVLLYIYKEHGIEGVEKFARNVKTVEDGPKVAKLAGTNNPGSAAIYIAPRIFAKSCVKEGLDLVIPQDGAMIYPFSMLVKKGKEKQLKVLIDFVMDDYGSDLLNSHALSLSPNLDNKDLEDFDLKWLGWDFIKSNDMFKLEEELIEVFNKIYNKK